MKILYIAQRYDYGQKSRGLSFEHYNFYESLRAMGHTVVYFDYPSVADSIGRSAANRQLEIIAYRDRPDVLFSVIQGDIIDSRVIRKITEQTKTVTINWFCDDHWQFESHARHWAPCFNYVVTTSQSAIEKYQKHGLANVIKSQWGANHHTYHPTPGKPVYDVTFVGQPYGIRQHAIEQLRRAGIKVHTWGNGWPDGKLEQPEMIRTFGRSRINLNFADASSVAPSRLANLAKCHRVSALRDKPGLWRIWETTQKLARWDKARTNRKSALLPPRQIKGRVFEVPACGGFLLTQPAEDLQNYLKPGQDCATFESTDDLVQRVHYYLNNESERLAIAQQGYTRTISQHTYAARFEAIFSAAGLAECNTVNKAA